MSWTNGNLSKQIANMKCMCLTLTYLHVHVPHSRVIIDHNTIIGMYNNNKGEANMPFPCPYPSTIKEGGADTNRLCGTVEKKPFLIFIRLVLNGQKPLVHISNRRQDTG